MGADHIDSEKIDNTYAAQYDFIKCSLYILEGNYQLAISEFKKKATEYQGTPMEVDMIARIASVYGECLNDTTNARIYAEQAATLNPGDISLERAFNAAGIEYDPIQYEDIFHITETEINEPEPTAKITPFINSIGAYPNPFNPITTITYSIAEQSFVTLDIYSVVGQKVAELVHETKSAGSYTVRFDGSQFGSGIYLYSFRTKNFHKNGKLLLVK